MSIKFAALEDITQQYACVTYVIAVISIERDAFTQILTNERRQNRNKDIRFVLFCRTV